MTIKMDRPPFILAYAADVQGCGHHRIIRPMEIMQRSGVLTGRAEVNLIPPDILSKMQPDVIVWQRQMEDSQIEVMKQAREACPNATFVYEIDDAISAVPLESWHYPFLPTGIDAKIARGAKLCDIISVSTHALGNHMRKIVGPGPKIHVAPNMLGKDDLMVVDRIRTDMPRQDARTFRIGWGGGISHAGDLKILETAMRTLLDVTWVFLGMKPNIDIPNIEFHPGVPPSHYTAALANLNLDLMVAPLDDNLFNRCKSNLRLLEAGVCGYPVIASPVEPYLENNPPVEYADGPGEWLDRIQSFIDFPDRRLEKAARLNEWVKRDYIMDDHAADRLQHWLPQGTKPFVPKRAVPEGPVCVVIPDAAEIIVDMVRKAGMKMFKSVEDAIHVGAGDIIVIRKGSALGDSFFERVKAAIEKNFSDTALAENATAPCSTISFMTNDEAVGSFPKKNAFNQHDSGILMKIDNVCALLANRAAVEIAGAGGPAIIVNRKALVALGNPDFEINTGLGEIAEEWSIIEWSMRAHSRGFRNLLDPAAYVVASIQARMLGDSVTRIATRIGSRWPRRKIDENAADELRQDVELIYHREYFTLTQIENQQDFSTWASIADTPSAEQIKTAFAWSADRWDGEVGLAHDLTMFMNIVDYSKDSATDTWIIFRRHNAEISKHAVALIRDAIGSHPDARFIYADHDHLYSNQRVGPFFKPIILDRHMLLGQDYVSQIGAIKINKQARRLIEEIAHIDLDSLDQLIYAIALHMAFDTNGQYLTEFVHIDRILADVAAVPPDLAVCIKKTEIAQSICNELDLGVVLTMVPTIPIWNEVSYKGCCTPKVTIIIPTGGNIGMLEPCINTIVSKTKYDDLEILVLPNGKMSADALAYLHRLKGSVTAENPEVEHPRTHTIKVIDMGEGYVFNWSAINNHGVRLASEPDIIVFMNDDTRIMDPNWLNEMVGALHMPGVGTVGAKLLYPSDQIQHVGVVCHGGATGHIHKGLPAGHPGYHGLAFLSHETTCNTGAVLAVKTEVFHEIGGFDEEFAHNFNDVAFGLRARELGYVNVVAMKAVIQHMEGVTRTNVMSPEGAAIQQAEGQLLGKKFPARDPYWNHNLAFISVQNGQYVAGLNYDLFSWPPRPWPWQRSDEAKDRVLLLGPTNSAADELRNGDSVYELSVIGHVARVVRPYMENFRQIDLRDPIEATKRLDKLGINRILVTSVGDMHPSLLHFFADLGYPVEYRPMDAEVICPRHNLVAAEAYCDGGWRRGECQSCIKTNGSIHGNVTVDAWMLEWMRFISNPSVTINPNHMAAEEFSGALAEALTALHQRIGIANVQGGSNNGEPALSPAG